LKGLTAQMVADNKPMLHLFHSLEKKEYDLEMQLEAGVFYLTLDFKWDSVPHCG
jgi:hypothetical protein